jgi:hypothetical protein
LTGSIVDGFNTAPVKFSQLIAHGDGDPLTLPTGQGG